MGAILLERAIVIESVFAPCMIARDGNMIWCISILPLKECFDVDSILSVVWRMSLNFIVFLEFREISGTVSEKLQCLDSVSAA